MLDATALGPEVLRGTAVATRSDSAAIMRAWLDEPAVAAKVEELRLRYLIVVAHGTEVAVDAAEFLIMGMSAGKDIARISAEVVNLEALCCRVGGSARGVGPSGHVHVGFFGVIVLSPTGRAACTKLADALLTELRPAG